MLPEMSPKQIQILEGKKVISCAAGAQHSIVLTGIKKSIPKKYYLDSNEVFGFGSNQLGQLGSKR